MNVINLHSSCTMILLGILASTTIIGLTSSAPLSSYERRDLSVDRPKIFLLMDQRIPELESEIFGDPGSAMKRTKRIGSLSIVNSLDVLRQRVLLELARRKAQQDQRQIDANRRFLETIGKRSAPEYEPDSTRIMTNSRDYASQQQQQQQRPESHDRNALSGRTQDWFEENDSVFSEPQDDRMARVQANELRLL